MRVLGGLGVRGHGHENIQGVESEILLKTEAAEGISRLYKVTQGFLELPTMTADVRVQRGCGLSFVVLPPDVPLSSIWTDGGLEGLEGLEGSE